MRSRTAFEIVACALVLRCGGNAFTQGDPGDGRPNPTSGNGGSVGSTSTVTGGGTTAGAPVEAGVADASTNDVSVADASTNDVSIRQDARPESGSPSAVFSVGSFVKTAAVGVQVVPHALGQVPKALLLWTVGKPNAAQSSDYLFALGTTNAPGSSMSAAMASRDNVTPTSSSRRMARNALSVVEWGQVTLAEADLTAWDATNLTLDWTTNNDVGYVVHYIAIGGPAVSAKVVSWQAPIVPGITSVTGVGFRPDVVLHFYVGWFFTATPPASDTNAGFGFGAMDLRGGQWASHLRASDLKMPSLTGKTQRTDSSIYISHEVGPEVTKQASFVSMDTDGFTMNFTTSNFSASQLFSLAITGLSASVGSFAKVTGGSPLHQAVTPTGFQPGLVVLSSVQSIADTGIATEHARLGIGASDGANAVSSALSDTDGVTPSMASAIDPTGSAFVKVNNPNGSVEARAEVASFDPNGFTLNWTANDPVATQICYVALGAR